MSDFTIKSSYAGIALFAGIGLLYMGALLPPIGKIDGSFLYGSGQLFILAATLLGFGHTIQKITNAVNEIKDIRNGNSSKRS